MTAVSVGSPIRLLKAEPDRMIVAVLTAVAMTMIVAAMTTVMVTTRDLT
jgi:hypothetical protein